MASGEGRGFVRESTGLVRSLSLFDAVAINVSYMSTGAALALIGFTMILLPSVLGVNLVCASLIGFLISIPQVVVYTVMSGKTSRTGGDYVWMSRSLGGLAGSAVTFMGITMETMPYLALIALSTVFAIGSVGVALGNGSFLGLSLPGNVAGADQLEQFVLAAVVFAVLIGLNIVRPRWGFRLISVFMVVGMLALVLAAAAILTAGQQGVASYIGGLNATGSSGARLTYQYLASSYHGSAFSLGATVSVLPFFAIFVYPWFNASASVGSELKRGRATSWNPAISAVLACLVVTVPLAVMYYAGGLGFTNEALANSSLVNNYSFNFWTLGMGVSKVFAVKTVIGLGWVLWEAAILAFGIITISRYLLAQSFDRFLPSAMAYVSERWGSPVYAHLFDLVVTVALIGLAASIYGTLVSLYGAVLASMFYFLFVGLGAFVYGIRMEHGRDRGLLTVCGMLMAAVFSYISYEFLTATDNVGQNLWGGNPLAYGYIAVTFVAGVTIYLASTAYHRKRGMDISLLFKEIPPE